MKKRILPIIVLFIIVAGTFLVWFFLPSNYYIRQVLKHGAAKIDDYTYFENRVVEAKAPKPWEFSDQYNDYSLPEQYLPTFEELETVAYLIIKDSTILFEQYWDGYSETSWSNSFSTAKSIVSLAVGCALDEGLIQSVNQPVSDFFPEFPGYDGKVLTVCHLLTMSAGFDFDEQSYGKIIAPVNKLYYGNRLLKDVLAVKEIEEPGVYFEYQSITIQLLSFIVEQVTNESISSYVSRKLWTPMNAEENALWSLDKKDGVEKAFCCFNTNARDFARVGQLLLNKGEWGGKQLVSAKVISQPPYSRIPPLRIKYTRTRIINTDISSGTLLMKELK
ncbi:MAG: beta-lactamase family protein [Tannerellaceae bacterium]|nr:beta-lactamase family protein [Tannerellaceae bacterium]